MSPWFVADVMTTDVISVYEDTPFKQIVDLFESHSINAVPVIDSDRRVLGVVSSADLLPKIEFAADHNLHPFADRRLRLAHDKAAGIAAADLMTAPATTIQSDATLVRAASLLDAGRLKRLPVVDGAGRLAGIVTRDDLLKVFLRGDNAIQRDVTDEILSRLPRHDRDQITVEVDDGIVTLLGKVDHPLLLRPVIESAEAVPGVIEVLSYITTDEDDLVG